MSERRYYATPRTEVMPHLPANTARLLDLGCGDGATVAAIRAERALAWAGGIEVVPKSGALARGICDEVWIGDFARELFEAAIPPASLDAVLCLDVLEHLADPWAAVARLAPLLRPGGRLIVSVPNLRNWKFIWGLAARGDFRYRDAGLLDRTHLRFFVKETAVALTTGTGLRLLHAGPARPFAFPEARWWLARAGAEEFVAKQWLIVAER